MHNNSTVVRFSVAESKFPFLVSDIYQYCTALKSEGKLYNVYIYVYIYASIYHNNSSPFFVPVIWVVAQYYDDGDRENIMLNYCTSMTLPSSNFDYFLGLKFPPEKESETTNTLL